MQTTNLLTPSGSFALTPGAGAFSTTDTSFDNNTEDDAVETSFLQRGQSIGTPSASMFQPLDTAQQQGSNGVETNAESSDDGELTENDVDLLMGALGDDDVQEDSSSSSSDDGEFEPLERQESIKSRLSFSLPVLDADDGPSTDAFEPIEHTAVDDEGEDDDEEDEKEDNEQEDGDDEASSSAVDDDRADLATEPTSEPSPFVPNQVHRKRMRPGGPVDEVPISKQQRPVDDWSEAQAVSSLISAPFL